MKEAFSCNAPQRALCKETGIVEAVSAAFITTNYNLDYTLLKLDATLAAKYGYLQARTTPVSTGTSVYMPQHARGGCKLISFQNDQIPPRNTQITATNIMTAYVLSLFLLPHHEFM